ncbi:MAG: hypothetical protein ABI619_08855 [Betaproteobacteria bacterium]
MKIIALFGLTIVAHATAWAADPSTVEELAVIRESEVARLDKTSILSRGDEARFDVGVAWRDPSQKPQGEPVTRVVRYVAHCKDKTLAPAMVVTYDEYGRTLKRYLVPPGSGEYSAPQAGSQESGWVEQACRN